MKVFVTGVCGQLGHDAVLELTARGHLCVGSDLAPACEGLADTPYAPLDITDAEAVSHALDEAKPDAVIHCAAWTAVDAAEEHEAQARAVNAQGTANIAAACRRLGCKMMYISTDYVFSGEGEAPWRADCRDFAPLSVYGRTKLEGEEAVRAQVEKRFIVRTAWVFGLNGKNFVKTMLALGEKYDSLRVVYDQIGTPTYTPDLARLLADMIVTDRYGDYHATNEGGYISWADFAKAIFARAGMGTQVVPVTTEEYGLSKAARPKNSRLDKRALAQAGFAPLPPWQDALDRFLRAMGRA
ncbi:MAG: dTDP-4-dehydrorhamnose reductase [Clostridia bacterium]|nr:dTDP-4-dehydrorhamnose reductase [Clostridia bacterium]